MAFWISILITRRDNFVLFSLEYSKDIRDNVSSLLILPIAAIAIERQRFSGREGHHQAYRDEPHAHHKDRRDLHEGKVALIDHLIEPPKVAYHHHHARHDGLGAAQLDERELRQERVVRDVRDDAQDDLEARDLALEQKKPDVNTKDPDDDPAENALDVLPVLFNEVGCIIQSLGYKNGMN